MSRLPSSFPSSGGENANLNKQCPAVIPNCLDPSCLGDPDRGCSAPSDTMMGCNCTGTAFSEYLKPDNSSRMSVSEDPCPSSISCASSVCQSNAVGGGTEAICGVQPLKGCPCQVDPQESPERCPLSTLLCSDPHCEGIAIDIPSEEKTGFCHSLNFSGCKCELNS